MTRGAWFMSAVAIGLLAQVTGCGGDDAEDDGASAGQAGAEPGSAGGSSAVSLEVANAMCDTLGDLCHITGYSEGLVAECHQLGHAREPDVCVERFVECANECLSLRPHAGGEPVAGGAAGAGTGQGGESHGGAADHPEGGASGSDLCLALGTLCHDAEGDLAAECHEIGHDGTPEQCQERFEECAVACVVGQTGGGEGGASSSGGAAGAAG